MINRSNILTPAESYFIKIYKYALHKKTYPLEEVDKETFQNILEIARIQHLLPMICHAIYPSKAALQYEEIFQTYRNQCINEMVSQVVSTKQFIDLLHFLEQKGLSPLVVKGIVLRNIYPHEHYRYSTDEDLIISAEEKYAYHQALLEYGMVQDDENDIETADEISYEHPDSKLYIEVHQNLFPPDSSAYGDLNNYFDYEKVTIDYHGTPIYTLDFTNHLFYLLCHSFKHFIHGGFGIRQVSDFGLFSHTYAKEIDWIRFRELCESIQVFEFSKAMYKICTDHLLVQPAFLYYIKDWNLDAVDETDLLKDVLAAGIYGASDMVRHHSSNATLEAINRHKQNKKSRGSLFSNVFVSYKNLKGRYAYLEKYPFLMPIAWAQRIIDFLKREKKNENPLEIVQMGNKRVDLLKKYKIIK
ncbi:MAG: nucleotidyltransferase family protein [Bacillota bacterium]|nr:nucleotidyltransferase family protein [Bacillota bacterium]